MQYLHVYYLMKLTYRVNGTHWCSDNYITDNVCLPFELRTYILLAGLVGNMGRYCTSVYKYEPQARENTAHECNVYPYCNRNEHDSDTAIIRIHANMHVFVLTH